MQTSVYKGGKYVTADGRLCLMRVTIGRKTVLSLEGEN
jgi:hypothetical protein